MLRKFAEFTLIVFADGIGLSPEGKRRMKGNSKTFTVRDWLASLVYEMGMPVRG